MFRVMMENCIEQALRKLMLSITHRCLQDLAYRAESIEISLQTLLPKLALLGKVLIN